MSAAGDHGIVVLISGRGRNLQALIEACAEGRVPGRIVRVISNRADAGGLKFAQDAGIPTSVLSHKDFVTREAFDAELARLIAAESPKAVVLAGFMRILGSAFIAQFQGRLLNIHPSLLPLYPGLHTHDRALEAGDAEHGATVHFVTDELDGGPGIVRGRIVIHEGDTADVLAARVMEEVELKIYPQAVAWLLQGALELDAGQARLNGRTLHEPIELAH